MSSKLLLIAPAALALAGCAVNPVSGSYDPGFGEAYKYSNALQTIDPDPVYAEGGAQPGDHGDKGAQAVKRYRTDAVKAVQTETTTSSSGGSGGGPR